MASGRKSYFRHSFNARNDTKLRLFRDHVGVGFYFYYFTLLELCAENIGDEKEAHFEFHESVIRQLWCMNLRKCESTSVHLNATGLVLFKKVGKTFHFTIPNLLKYLGRYETNCKVIPLIKKEINKERNILEKPEKEISVKVKKPRIKKHILSESSPLEGLFPDDEDIRHWLRSGSVKIQENIAATYQDGPLAEEIRKAYYWQSENLGKARAAGVFLSSVWLPKSKIPRKLNMDPANNNLHNFLSFDEATK
jgi:hypothetical protein